MHNLIVRNDTVFAEMVRVETVRTVSVRSVIALVVLVFCSPHGNAQGFDRVKSGALHCLQSGNHAVCQRALDDAEVLQRLASSRQAYPCQTMLLGVQADLILQQLGDGRGDLAISDLEAARRSCPGL